MVWAAVAHGWYLHPGGSERLVEAGTQVLGGITSQMADEARGSKALRASFWDGVDVRLPHTKYTTPS